MTPQSLHEATERYLRPLRYPDVMSRTGERPQTPEQEWRDVEHVGWRLRRLSDRFVRRGRRISAKRHADRAAA